MFISQTHMALALITISQYFLEQTHYLLQPIGPSLPSFLKELSEPLPLRAAYLKSYVSASSVYELDIQQFGVKECS